MKRSSKEKQRDIWVDTLRGGATLGVVAAHCLTIFPSIGVRASGMGKIFVSLFFVLSGYYAFDDIESVIESKKRIVQYWIKRFVNIIPLFWVCLWAGYLLKEYSAQSTIRCMFLIEGIGHFWYVPVIMGFYFIVPFVGMLLKNTTGKKRILIYIIIVCVMEILFPFFRCEENSIIVFYYIPSFMMGSIVKEMNKKIISHKSIVNDAVCLLILACFVIIVPGIRELMFGIQPDRYLQNKIVFMSVGWSTLIFLIPRGKWLLKALNTRNALARVSVVGYEIYLIHYLLIQKFLLMGVEPWKNAGLTLLLTGVLSIPAFLCIHKPLNDWMNRRCQKKEKSQVV